MLWNQRGNDYEAHRRRLNRLFPLAGKDIFLAGVGMGREIPSWMPYRPASILAVDYFRYDRAWSALSAKLSTASDGTRLTFKQADISRTLPFADDSFDVVGSDALFEHCGDLPSVLREMLRLLRPGGCVYATFGPIYTSCGGDHFSGAFELRNAYDHLLLSAAEYTARIKNTPTHSDDQQEDFRTWIDNGMFSYLRYDEYIRLFMQEPSVIFLQTIHNPSAFKFRRAYPAKWKRLLELGCHERDLLTLGMTVILRKA